MSVVVILLMFLAVMAMVKRVDDRQGRAIVVSDSREMENDIRPQTD